MQYLRAATILPFTLLACLLAGNFAFAQQRWPDERQAGRFHCHANFSLAPHQNLLGELARLEHDVLGGLKLGASREPVHLFLFGNHRTYQQYVKQYFPSAPTRRALFIKSRGPGMVFAYYNREFAIDVRHECTHAILHSVISKAPLWLDEGLAEYFEAPPEARASGNAHLRTVKWEIYITGLPGIEKLEALKELGEMRSTEYRYAWAWVHFMLHGPPAAKAELLRYLADLRSGAQAGNLSDRLRRRFPDLDKRVVAHFKNWKN